MVLKHIKEINKESALFYYELNDQNGAKVHNPVIMEEDRHEHLIEIIKRSFPKETIRFFNNVPRSPAHKPDIILKIVQFLNKAVFCTIPYTKKNAELASSNDVLYIPLYEIGVSEKQELSVKEEAEAQSLKNLSGVDVIVTDFEENAIFKGEVKGKEQLVLKTKEGILVDPATKEVIAITRDFLDGSFEHLQPKQKEKKVKEYLPLEEALQAIKDLKHVHVDLFVPGEKPQYDICCTNFLLLAEVISEGEDDPVIQLELLRLRKKIEQNHEDINLETLLSFPEESDEFAFGQLINPMNARIPLEILIHGSFYIGDHK